MKDLEQLISSLTLMNEGREFDININIPVSGGAFYDCLKVNGEICASHFSPISFGGERLIFPHVTLKMGTVVAGKADEITERLCKVAASVSAFTLTPQPVILKAPENKYYFSEIDDGGLAALGSVVEEALKDCMTAARHPLGRDNLHHITLGYKAEEDTATADVIGKKIRPFTADRFLISIKGKLGVCVGTVRAFPLKK